MASSNIVRQSYCGKHNLTFGERYQPIVNGSARTEEEKFAVERVLERFFSTHTAAEWGLMLGFCGGKCVKCGLC